MDKVKKPVASATVSKENEPIVTIEATLVRSQPSVLIKNNGKGEKSYEVKVYADTVEEALSSAKNAAADLDKFVK